MYRDTFTLSTLKRRASSVQPLSMSHSLNTVPAARRVVMTNELVTGPPAAEMLRRSSITLASDTEVRVLDNATGGGILVAELFKQIPNSLAVGRILAGDIDEQVLHYSSMRKEESVDAEPRWRRVELMKIDQQVRAGLILLLVAACTYRILDRQSGKLTQPFRTTSVTSVLSSAKMTRRR